MKVELVYIPEDATKQFFEAIDVPVGASVRQAIELSAVLAQYPDINLSENTVGIFSKRCNLDTKLQDGDRIEIYRPLIIDPKDARRLRAEKKEAE